MRASIRLLMLGAAGTLSAGAWAVQPGTIQQEVIGYAENGEVRQRVVSYADLDATHEAGAATLYRRITIAAESVCEITDSRRASHTLREQECQDAATDRAVADVNSMALTRYHAARSGMRAPTAIAKR